MNPRWCRTDVDSFASLDQHGAPTRAAAVLLSVSWWLEMSLPLGPAHLPCAQQNAARRCPPGSTSAPAACGFGSSHSQLVRVTLGTSYLRGVQAASRDTRPDSAQMNHWTPQYACKSLKGRVTSKSSLFVRKVLLWWQVQAAAARLQAHFHHETVLSSSLLVVRRSAADGASSCTPTGGGVRRRAGIAGKPVWAPHPCRTVIRKCDRCARGFTVLLVSSFRILGWEQSCMLTAEVTTPQLQGMCNMQVCMVAHLHMLVC